MRAAQAGDRDALDTLLRRHYDRVFSLCRRLCGDHADALDAAQEALIIIARRLDRFDGRAAFTTWAYRVTTNACLDELRRRRRRPAAVEDIERGPSLAGTGPAGPRSFDADPAGAVADRIDIDRALRRLPEPFRVAVVLRDLCGLDYAEIADVLGIPPGTVRSRIARARAALARDLAPPGNADGASPAPRADEAAPTGSGADGAAPTASGARADGWPDGEPGSGARAPSGPEPTGNQPKAHERRTERTRAAAPPDASRPQDGASPP